MRMAAAAVVGAMAAAAAAANGGGGGAEYQDKPCALSDLVGHNWTYIAPAAFKGGIWDSQHACIYQFKACGAQCFEFAQPPQCIDGRGVTISPGAKATLGAPGATPGGQQLVSLQYTAGVAKVRGTGVVKVGWMSARCSLIDVEDGGMYVRGNPDGACHLIVSVFALWRDMQSGDAKATRVALPRVLPRPRRSEPPDGLCAARVPAAGGGLGGPLRDRHLRRGRQQAPHTRHPHRAERQAALLRLLVSTANGVHHHMYHDCPRILPR